VAAVLISSAVAWERVSPGMLMSAVVCVWSSCGGVILDRFLSKNDASMSRGRGVRVPGSGVGMKICDVG
jgi:hypothetical protein